MERRSFLKKASVAGVAAVAVTKPAAAVDVNPSIKWRMASSFPKSVDVLYGGAENFCKRIAQLTNGKFEITVSAAGEIVPGNQVLDAVQNNTVTCGQTVGYYYVGKNKTLAFDTGIPFGLTARQQNAWLYQGGGLELMRELYGTFGVVNFPGGNTGVQMGGWFRKEIKGLSDLKGLKMRIPGMGGELLARLGVVPQSLTGADVYPALEKGTIDATEWVGPYDDEKLGFYKIAPHYYYPSFWEPGSMVSYIVNKAEWEKLPAAYKAAFEAAAAEGNVVMQANYDKKNPEALVSLLQKGVKLHKFPDDILKAAQGEAFKMYDEEAAKNPSFAKVYDSWKKFRNLQQGWFGLAENALETFMYTNRKGS